MYNISFVIKRATKRCDIIRSSSIAYHIFLSLFIDRPVSISSTAFDAIPNKDRRDGNLERGQPMGNYLQQYWFVTRSAYTTTRTETIGVLQSREEATAKLYLIYRYMNMRQFGKYCFNPWENSDTIIRGIYFYRFTYIIVLFIFLTNQQQ